MEVRLSHSFTERIRSVDPEYEQLDGAAALVLLVHHEALLSRRRSRIAGRKERF